MFRPKDAIINGALVVMISFFALILLEGLLRVTGIAHQQTFDDAMRETRTAIDRQKSEDPDLPIQQPLYLPDPVMGWKMTPNLTYSLAAHAHYERKTLKTNSLGMADREPSGKPPVFVLGDSFVEGLSVPYEKHFTSLLEKTFPSYDFWNMGVSGYGNVQEMLALQSYIDRKPAHVIFSIYFGNDIGDNAFATNISMLGIADYRREFVPFFRDGKVIYAKDMMRWKWLYGSQLFLLARKALEGFGKEPAGLTIAKDMIGFLSDDLGRKSIGFSVLLIPTDAQITGRESEENYDALLRYCAERGIDFISLLPEFRSTGRTTMGYIDGKGNVIDPHWDSVTHEVVSTIIAAQLRNTGTFTDRKEREASHK